MFKLSDCTQEMPKSQNTAFLKHLKKEIVNDVTKKGNVSSIAEDEIITALNVCTRRFYGYHTTAVTCKYIREDSILILHQAYISCLDPRNTAAAAICHKMLAQDKKAGPDV